MIPKISPNEWEFEFQQREAYPVLMSDLWIRAIRDFIPRELKLPVKVPDYLFTTFSKGYIRSRDKKDIIQKLQKALEDPRYLQYIFERTMGVMREFDKEASRAVSSVVPCSSGDDIAKVWDFLEKKYLKIISWFWIPWYVTEENIISDRVKIGLEKYRHEIETVIDFNTALGILLFPVKEAAFQKEQRDFAELLILASKNPSFEKNPEFELRAKEYLSRYAWMKTYFLIPFEPLSYRELAERVRKAVAGTFMEEYDLQRKKKEEYGEIAHKLFKIFRDDKLLLQNIGFARELAWLLTASIEEGIWVTSKLIPFYKLIAQKLGVSYNRWVYFTGDEVTECLRGEKNILAEELERRVSACAVLMRNGKLMWMYGEEAREFSNRIETEVGKAPKDVSEFSGQPAYRGKVAGTVRVALTSEATSKLTTGEILVTSMTSPDYVPAMRRSAAIVTNEGGLLCHAAIMSREFGKPCIVGTKIATKVLKDGDTVEVDADKGIVKILKRKRGQPPLFSFLRVLVFQGMPIALIVPN